MPQLKVQNFYSTALTSDITGTGDTSFTVAVAPAYTSGFLVISPNNASLREIVYFHNVVGNTVSVRSENRGQGGTTAKAHTSSEPVAMKDIAEIFNMFSDSISQCFFVEKTGGLTVKVWGGTVFYNGNPVTVADKALILADNQTNYIKYSYPTNTISVDTVNSGNIKAKVVTFAGVITSIQYYVAKESYIDFSVTITGALPDQSGNAGKALITDGTNVSWGVSNLPRTIGIGKTMYVDPATGVEVVKDTTQVSTFNDSDVIIGRKSDGTEARGLFSGIKSQLGNAGKYIRTVPLSQSISSGAPVAMAIVSSPVVYSNTMGANIAGARVKSGIRFSIPYATTLGIVKTSQLSTSANARVQLYLDDGTTLVAEQTPSSSDTVTFPDTPLSANIVYRLVVNDSSYFNANNNELALATYQSNFQFCISGTLNGTNTVEPQNIKELRIGTKSATPASASSGSADGITFTGFVQGPKNKGDMVELNANEGSIVSGFSALTINATYYLSNTAGAISTSLGTAKYPIGKAVSATEIFITKRESDKLKTLGNVTGFYHYGGNVYVDFTFPSASGSAQSASFSGPMSVTLNSFYINQSGVAGSFRSTQELPQGMYSVTYGGTNSGTISLSN